VSSSLSPIFYLFLTPAGKLYLKVQHLLKKDHVFQRTNPPLLKHQRPGPKDTNYGIPAELWPTVIHRVVEQKESLRTVAAAFGVSHETIRAFCFMSRSSVDIKKRNVTMNVPPTKT